MSTADLKLGLESGTPVEEINVSLNLENVEFSKGYKGNAVMRVTSGAASYLPITAGNKRKTDTKPKKSNKKFKADVEESTDFDPNETTSYEC
jgi:hypothetical protein